MSRHLKDLWPEDVADSTNEIAPVTILRQQAALLGKKTKNLVEAEVETKTADFQRFLQHTFYLIAPALDFYRYPLFQVMHRATDWYPLTIIYSLDSGKSSRLLSKKLPLENKVFDKSLINKEVVNEEEFLTELKNILASDETRKTIQKLIAQSKS